MAFLVIEKGTSADNGKLFVLGAGSAVIGRDSPDSNADIVINDDYVSRKHAEVKQIGDDFVLCDLGSKNGTEIDGRRIEPGKLFKLTRDSVIGLAIVSGEARVTLRFKQSGETLPANSLEASCDRKEIAWLRIDDERKEVWIDGKPVTFSKKEYTFIWLLYCSAGKVCSRDEIIPAVWPDAKDLGGVSDAMVDQLVHRIREKIEPEPLKPRRIRSKKTFGYILV
jgi:pSer/pThr/pTyr-binding forkhead associated (FHA) protein